MSATLPSTLAFTVNNPDFLLSHREVLVRGAVAQGYRVHVVAPDGPGRSGLEALGASFHPWQLERGGQKAADEARAMGELTRLYAALRPALVHHVTVKPILYGSAAAALTGVRGVVNAVSGLGYVFLSAGFRARARRAAVVAAYRAAFSRRGTRVVLQNDDDEADLRAAGALDGATVVKIRGSGVDLSGFAPDVPPPPGPPLVVLPARLLKDKGVADFAEAARLLRARGVAARLALVGGFDEGNPASVTRQQLDGWLAEGRLEWWGHRADMPEVFRQASVVALPSYREGMPKALLEAAAAGRAIVATDVPGCRDAVDFGRVGRLVPVRDPRALAEALEQLLADEAERRRLGALARAHAEACFSQEQVLQAHLRLYGALLA